jgi:3-isopropylmalate/(R)-2-methylmalate dehydratase small subunit
MPTKFTKITSRVVNLPVNNIDTDQIIPARFLKGTDKSGMGANLFADWRYLPDGTPNSDFVLNRSESQGASILVAGDNFGCGSSREHAPWALNGFGFRAVVSTSFADIFRNNSFKNGLLPVAIDANAYQTLQDYLAEVPSVELTIDLVSQTVTFPTGQSVSFPIDSFSKACLLDGTDELGYILSFDDQISKYEKETATY